MSAIDRVLKDLDSLGDKAIQKRILGLGDDEEAKSEETQIPADDATKPVEADDTDKLSPELLEKLKALLSQG